MYMLFLDPHYLFWYTALYFKYDVAKWVLQNGIMVAEYIDIGEREVQMTWQKEKDISD